MDSVRTVRASTIMASIHAPTPRTSLFPSFCAVDGDSISFPTSPKDSDGDSISFPTFESPEMSM